MSFLKFEKRYITQEMASDYLKKGVDLNLENQFIAAIENLSKAYHFYSDNKQEMIFDFAIASFFLGCSFKSINAPYKATFFLEKAVAAFKEEYRKGSLSNDDNNAVLTYLITAQYNLSQAWLDSGEINRALDGIFSIKNLLLNLQLYKIEENLAQAAANCFLLLSENGNFSNQQKLDYIDKAIELNPRISLQVKQSILLIDSGKYQQAKLKLAELVNQDMEQSLLADAFYHLAKAEIYLNNPASAIPFLKNALNYYSDVNDLPNKHAAALGLALVFSRLKQVDESLKYFKTFFGYWNRLPDDKQKLAHTMVINWCEAAGFPNKFNLDEFANKPFKNLYNAICSDNGLSGLYEFSFSP